MNATFDVAGTATKHHHALYTNYITSYEPHAVDKIPYMACMYSSAV